MTFSEHSQARRQQVEEREYEAIRIDELAYRYIDEVFSCDALGYSAFRHYKLERIEGFDVRIVAHEQTIHGRFAHVRIGAGFGGRWTFHRGWIMGGRVLDDLAIFAIEFDGGANLRYGTQGPWTSRIERNPKEPWKARDRLIANVVASIQDHLEWISVKETIHVAPEIIM